MAFLYGKIIISVYYLCVMTMEALLVIFSRWRVNGKENIPKDGPVLIVANHLNLADPPLLAASFPRRLTFMAKRELFQSWITRPIVQAFSFPVSRGDPNRESLRQAEQTLKHGRPLVMFPEGKRSPHAQMTRAFLGTSLIALRARAPILPMGVVGSQKITSVGSVFRHPHITVNIGPSFHLPSTEGKPTRAQLTQATEIIMRHIAELLPEGYRGEYREIRSR